ncbi:phosphoketolase family protein [Streptomyces sp. LP05-1]|uniref:Phosphoketolase family protein n=1 Tax=Streptomyces pyxinae TaxID=2970734 RepID=A0ABT2CJL4_9ACTN|nr:phosphoketolase family protein [Streptomyces sp. LP05-1]MCS0637485.1 phosphoketolase family protein [Streptomyces sp. LP05-1]
MDTSTEAAGHHPTEITGPDPGDTSGDTGPGATPEANQPGNTPGNAPGNTSEETPGGTGSEETTEIIAPGPLGDTGREAGAGGSTLAYRRAADYVAAALIFLRDNVLLREPLRREHLKPRLLGHWGSCPGITLVYAALDTLIRERDTDVLLVTGPGHGAPANHANLWLEGTHEAYDPALARTEEGLRALARRYCAPDGFPSHLSPAVPGTIHEGGELGYALATAFGAAFDAPDRLVACIVGDGEAETGPTAAAWHSTKFLDPVTGGAVLPILHLNGYKISSPTVFAAMSDRELTDLFRGYGWDPRIVDVTADPDGELVTDAVRDAHTAVRAIQRAARHGGPDELPERPAWPMLVLRSLKGQGAPAEVGGKRIEGTFHAHQVPLPKVHDDDEQFAALEAWLRSYGPEELFDERGRPRPEVLAVCPEGDRRIGAQPAGDGGRLREPLDLPPLEPYAVDVHAGPGSAGASPNRVLAAWLTEVTHRTQRSRDFRIMSPDELASNKLDSVLGATGRGFAWPVGEYAEDLSRDGRVLEVLSEHNCQGWLQGYLQTGRHGLFPTYEAFASVVDSMLNQYAKWLKMSREVAWRTPVSSLTYLLTSEGWRQEHNGYSHQGPGFINNLLTKKSTVTGVYLPPDANTLLVTMERLFTDTGRINLVVAGKHNAAQWLGLEDARRHCAAGASVWRWASTHGGEDPEIVLACAGGIPTVETLAAAQLLRRDLPDVRLRVVNVVDLCALAPPDRHPHGLADAEFRALFGDDTEVIFDFHGYPSAVHQLLHGRPNPGRFHVRGYIEEGTTTTPYDLLASNGVSRHDLAVAALARLRGRPAVTGDLASAYAGHRDRLRAELRRTGVDPAEITEWAWQP